MHAHPNPLDTDIAGAMLHDRLRQSSVSSAINAHLTSVQTDEAQFDDNGVPYDPAVATETQREEIKRFRDFSQIPCATAADVQAKIRYLLYGSIGDRDELLTCLTMSEYTGECGWEEFLQSLLITEPPRALTHARVAPGARAHENGA